MCRGYRAKARKLVVLTAGEDNFFTASYCEGDTSSYATHYCTFASHHHIEHDDA